MCSKPSNILQSLLYPFAYKYFALAYYFHIVKNQTLIENNKLQVVLFVFRT